MRSYVDYSPYACRLLTTCVSTDPLLSLVTLFNAVYQPISWYLNDYLPTITLLNVE